MNTNRCGLLLGFVSALLIQSCSEEPKKQKGNEVKQVTQAYQKIAPEFDADSAYYFVKKQVDFGPRVNNTPAHKKCGDWFVSEFRKYGAQVIEQTTLIPFMGKKLEARNVIASFNPKADKRVLLCAHWDSRPYADKDNRDTDKPILGADDGASGVGVLLEVARVMAAQPVKIGIDIVLFDAEDLGLNDVEGSWCLGSQYWSTHLHTPGYKADYGILLDMVGAHHATFAWEKNSTDYARPVMDKVWATAQNLGYGTYFIYYQSGPIEDDHYHVIKNTGIPTIDIIHYSATTPSSFPEHHHTHKDNMEVIDRNTLKAVGQTLLEVIYTEK